MSVNYILSQYIESAMSMATYDKLEDGTFVARIPSCKGVIAFASTATRVRSPITRNPRRMDFSRAKTRSYSANHQQHRSEQGANS